MSTIYSYAVIVVTLFFATSIYAQINTPRGSQLATVSQTVGTSAIEIEYSRPSVNDREIYGTPIVHYGFKNLGFGTSTAAPWRAGANENTKITFSDDVKIGGKSVKAGSYGYFIDVHDDNSTATIILSNNSSSWGSFFYSEEEDAMRIDVNTTQVPHTEVLTFSFNEVTPKSATVTLEWEKRGFPLTVDVDVTEIVLNEVRNGMRDQPGFNRQTWEQAANYSLNNDGDLEEALGWIDNAIAGQFYSQKTFANLLIKSGILTKMGKESEANALLDENLDIATIFEVHQFGRQLIGQGNKEKAMKIFQYNAKENKDTWPVHYGLARAYSANGDYKLALKHLEKAEVNAPNPASKGRVAANIEKLRNGEDIN